MSEIEHFKTVSKNDYTKTANNRKAAMAAARTRPTKYRSKSLMGMNDFMRDRVEKLRELYEIHTPKRTYEWVMPKGETDGRKAKRHETILGEDVSPFDLPDFEEIMPKPTDYNVPTDS